MTWSFAKAPLRCGGCPDMIKAGQVLRNLRTAPWPLCEHCAKRILGEEPPDSLEPPPEAPVPTTPSPSSQMAMLAARARQQLPFDFKRAQSGENDDNREHDTSERTARTGDGRATADDGAVGCDPVTADKTAVPRRAGSADPHDAPRPAREADARRPSRRPEARKGQATPWGAIRYGGTRRK